MADDNRPLKYIRYAFGEIILVVIGILIALQINTWNEERKSFSKSKTYLSEILKDLEADTLLFNNGIISLSDDIREEKWALSQRDYRPEQVDSIWDCFSGFYYNYAITDRTFQKIQNAEASQLIGFENLFNEITNYYTVLKERVDLHTAWDMREVSQRQEYMQDLHDHIEMSQYRMKVLSRGQLEGEFEMRQDSLENIIRVIDFANSIRGRNHFKSNYLRHIRVRNIFIELKSEAIGLMEEIDRVLEEDGK